MLLNQKVTVTLRVIVIEPWSCVTQNVKNVLRKNLPCLVEDKPRMLQDQQCDLHINYSIEYVMQKLPHIQFDWKERLNVQIQKLMKWNIIPTRDNSGSEYTYKLLKDWFALSSGWAGWREPRDHNFCDGWGVVQIQMSYVWHLMRV